MERFEFPDVIKDQGIFTFEDHETKEKYWFSIYGGKCVSCGSADKTPEVFISSFVQDTILLYSGDFSEGDIKDYIKKEQKSKGGIN